MMAADMILAQMDDESDLNDAYVTLCVQAGIAAGDVICCAKLGQHAQGAHDEAKKLLGQVDPMAVKHLDTLLRLKTFSGYSEHGSSEKNLKAPRRAAEHLLNLAAALA